MTSSTAVLPSDLFTIATFGTLAGSIMVTTLTTNGLAKAFGWRPKWLGLLVSFVVMAAALYLSDKIVDPKADIVGFFNSFLVYLSSAGATEAAAGSHRGGDDAKPPFFRSWFR